MQSWNFESLFLRSGYVLETYSNEIIQIYTLITKKKFRIYTVISSLIININMLKSNFYFS